MTQQAQGDTRTPASGAVYFSPREIVSELDRYVIGQREAKRAVAIALRNRWRRQQLQGPLKDEVMPKNILMIGPTGVGKTEIARRLARLAQAPFVKVEATKFTEVGYVGKDVDSIIRDLMENALVLVRDKQRRAVQAQAELNAENRVLDALIGRDATDSTRQSFRKMLREGQLNDRQIEVDLADNSSPVAGFDIPGMPGGSVGMMNLGDMLSRAMGGRTKRRQLTVAESYEILMQEEADRLIDQHKLVAEARELA